MPNHLASETSPYLLQHAANPVDWYPWGDEALTRAATEDKPICLSIGYSTCHWCHVMAHESFEDPATARVMNDHFVNIKVDKEERPDIDRVYQTCFQVMNQQGGGWPLTAFLSPHTHLPFFIATYVPDQPRHGLPAFRDLLAQAARYYHGQRERIDTQEGRLEEVLRNLENETPTSEWDPALELTACDNILQAFDREHGGIGGAPKFPMPSIQALLLRAGGPTGHAAVRHTLRQMSRGGIRDQIGGGFFRYATDARWEIPHFEKMLYDNGALLTLLARFAEDDELCCAGDDTVAWLEREMRAPHGAFYAAIDADSDGGEGTFYLFGRDEVAALVNDIAGAERLLHAWLNLDQPANFEGRWHLHQVCSLDAAAEVTGISHADARDLVDSIRHRLLDHRDQRPRPATDSKVIASWNALTVCGLLDFATATGQPDITRLGLDALDFIRTHLWDDTRLWSTWQCTPDGAGTTRHAGYLDDYALAALATWQSLLTEWSNERARWLCALLDCMIDRFGDGNGGFFFTDRSAPALILRDKEYLDNVTPSGNGVAALVLARCGHLFARPDWLRAAKATVRSGWHKVESYPAGGGTLFAAAAELRRPPTLVLLQGPQRRHWHERLAATADGIFAFALDEAAPVPMASGETRETTATVCRGDHCNGPFSRFDELRHAVAGSSA